jgi:hypothetical protein
MQDDVDQGQPKELAERRIPRHKTKEKIGVDEGFVKGAEEEVSQSPDPRLSGASAAEPSRIRSAREHRKALLRKRKLRD